MILALEVEENGGWKRLGSITEGSPPGSLSDNREGKRDIYLFGLMGERGFVSRSKGGADWEQGVGRHVRTFGTETVALLLNPGDNFEMLIRTDRMPEEQKVRFILLQ